jgi:hypothetical protein
MLALNMSLAPHQSFSGFSSGHVAQISNNMLFLLAYNQDTCHYLSWHSDLMHGKGGNPCCPSPSRAYQSIFNRHIMLWKRGDWLCEGRPTTVLPLNRERGEWSIDWTAYIPISVWMNLASPNIQTLKVNSLGEAMITRTAITFSSNQGSAKWKSTDY